MGYIIDGKLESKETDEAHIENRTMMRGLDRVSGWRVYQWGKSDRCLCFVNAAMSING